MLCPFVLSLSPSLKLSLSPNSLSLSNSFSLSPNFLSLSLSLGLSNFFLVSPTLSLSLRLFLLYCVTPPSFSLYLSLSFSLLLSLSFISICFRISSLFLFCLAPFSFYLSVFLSNCLSARILYGFSFFKMLYYIIVVFLH